MEKNKKASSNAFRTVKRTQPNPVHTAEIMASISKESIPSDVLGSYTGTPADGLVPEQDADDL